MLLLPCAVHRPRRIPHLVRRCFVPWVQYQLEEVRALLVPSQRLFSNINALGALPVNTAAATVCTDTLEELKPAAESLTEAVTFFHACYARDFWRQYGFEPDGALLVAVLSAFDLWAAVTLYMGHSWLKAYSMCSKLLSEGGWLTEPSMEALQLVACRAQLLYQQMAKPMATFIMDIEAQDPAVLRRHQHLVHPAIHRPVRALSLPLCPTPELFRHTNPLVVALVSNSPFSAALYADDILATAPAATANTADAAANLELAAAPAGRPVIPDYNSTEIRNLMSDARAALAQATRNQSARQYMQNAVPGFMAVAPPLRLDSLGSDSDEPPPLTTDSDNDSEGWQA